MSIPVIGAAIKSAFTALGSYGSLISSALTVGSTAISYQQANAAADAQEQTNNEANERARRYMIEDQDALTRMSQQEQAAASQKINETQIDAQRRAATTQVAATAGGVSGLSVDALLGDIFGNEASIRDSVNQNLEATGQQIQSERTSVMRGYTDTVNTRPSVNRPSLFGAALEAGTGVVGAYKDQWKIRGKTYGGGK